jgi:hypothetical protein
VQIVSQTDRFWAIDSAAGRGSELALARLVLYVPRVTGCNLDRENGAKQLRLE